VLEGDQVETLAFVSVVNFRIVSELRGVKFELKIEELILNQVIMELCLQTYLYYNLIKYAQVLNSSKWFQFL